MENRALTPSRFALLQESLCSFGCIRRKSQFGGVGISINRLTFGMISAKNELFLKGTTKTKKPQNSQEEMRFAYVRHGTPVKINYFLVTENIWDDKAKSEQLFYQTYNDILNQSISQSKKPIRIKDLPNLSTSIERRLWQAGIRHAEELKLLGAKASYLKIRELYSVLSSQAGLNMLLALAGAIEGCHSAVLSNSNRNELTYWYQKLF